MSMRPKNATTKFVRGGQTTQHWWRMAAQVLRTSLFFALGAFTATYIVLIFTNYEIRFMRETLATWTANFNIELGRPEKQIEFTDSNGQRRIRSAATRMTFISRCPDREWKQESERRTGRRRTLPTGNEPHWLRRIGMTR